MGFMQADLFDETIIVDGEKYHLTHQPVDDPDTGTVTILGVDEDNQEVLLEYELLDSDDPESYDIERPFCITDLDTNEIIYER